MRTWQHVRQRGQCRPCNQPRGKANGATCTKRAMQIFTNDSFYTSNTLSAHVDNITSEACNESLQAQVLTAKQAVAGRKLERELACANISPHTALVMGRLLTEGPHAATVLRAQPTLSSCHTPCFPLSRALGALPCRNKFCRRIAAWLPSHIVRAVWISCSKKRKCETRCLHTFG